SHIAAWHGSSLRILPGARRLHHGANGHARSSNAAMVGSTRLSFSAMQRARRHHAQCHETAPHPSNSLRKFSQDFINPSKSSKFFTQNTKYIIFLEKPPPIEPKVNKGKGVASSSHGSKRARTPSEDEHEDVNMAPPPLRGVDVTKTKELEGINGPVLTVNEHNARIDNMLSHLYGMKMLQLRMNGVTEEQLQQLNIDYPLSEHSQDLCRVGPGYEEPLNDVVATKDKMARVDLHI
ncbi:hypothetical protein HAX54_045788, partial [Datura stramonium]|nr:hypothetical protein [Datura stramonium]